MFNTNMFWITKLFELCLDFFCLALGYQSILMGLPLFPLFHCTWKYCCWNNIYYFVSKCLNSTSIVKGLMANISINLNGVYFCSKEYMQAFCCNLIKENILTIRKDASPNLICGAVVTQGKL